MTTARPQAQAQRRPFARRQRQALLLRLSAPPAHTIVLFQLPLWQERAATPFAATHLERRPHAQRRGNGLMTLMLPRPSLSMLGQAVPVPVTL